jgi:hypothetical protein
MRIRIVPGGKDDQCVRLTIPPPSVSRFSRKCGILDDSHNIQWASTACYRDNSPFTSLYTTALHGNRSSAFVRLLSKTSRLQVRQEGGSAVACRSYVKCRVWNEKWRRGARCSLLAGHGPEQRSVSHELHYVTNIAPKDQSPVTSRSLDDAVTELLVMGTK